jgi:hypothetical protein
MSGSSWKGPTESAPPQQRSPLPFVNTPGVVEVSKLLDAARNGSAAVSLAIHGSALCGKTSALLHAAQNVNYVYYFDVRLCGHLPLRRVFFDAFSFLRKATQDGSLAASTDHSLGSVLARSQQTSSSTQSLALTASLPSLAARGVSMKGLAPHPVLLGQQENEQDLELSEAFALLEQRIAKQFDRHGRVGRPVVIVDHLETVRIPPPGVTAIGEAIPLAAILHWLLGRVYDLGLASVLLVSNDHVAVERVRSLPGLRARIRPWAFPEDVPEVDAVRVLVQCGETEEAAQEIVSLLGGQLGVRIGDLSRVSNTDNCLEVAHEAVSMATDDIIASLRSPTDWTESSGLWGRGVYLGRTCAHTDTQTISTVSTHTHTDIQSCMRVDQRHARLTL